MWWYTYSKQSFHVLAELFLYEHILWNIVCFLFPETFQGKSKTLCISIGANTEISSNNHAFQYNQKIFLCHEIVRKLKSTSFSLWILYSRFQNKNLMIIITFNWCKAFHHFSSSSKQTNQFLVYFTLLDLHKFVYFSCISYSLNETIFDEIGVTEPSEDEL